MWIIGVLMSLVASFLSTVGILTQTRALQIKDACTRGGVWACGLAGMVVGAVMDLVAFGFAAQSMLAPLGGSTIVFNALLSPFFLDEKLTRTDMLATGIILAGCTLTVAFGDQSEQSFTVDDLIDAYTRWDVVLYFCVAGCGIVSVIVTLTSMERPYRDYLKEHTPVTEPGAAYPPYRDILASPRHIEIFQNESSMVDSESYLTPMTPVFSPMHAPLLSHVPTKASAQTNPAFMLASPRSVRQVVGIREMQIPIPEGASFYPGHGCPEGETATPSKVEVHLTRTKSLDLEIGDLEPEEYFTTPTHTPQGGSLDPAAEEKGLLEFVAYPRLHGFLYAAVAGTIGAQSVLFAKTLAEMVKNLGDAFASYQFYIILVCMAFTLVGQLRFLNMGLCYHPALLVVPIYQTHWVLVSIVAGGIYFEEFSSFTALSASMFMVGVIIALAGISILSYFRGKQDNSEDKAETKDMGDSNAAVNVNAVTDVHINPAAVPPTMDDVNMGGYATSQDAPVTVSTPPGVQPTIVHDMANGAVPQTPESPNTIARKRSQIV